MDNSTRPASLTARAVVLSLMVLGLGLAAAFWPTWALVPQYGGDPSWQLGISWGLELGLQWGPDVVFTFGPLGFMDYPMAFSRVQIVAASLGHVISAVAAVTFAYYVLERHVGLSRTWALGLAAVATAVGLYVTGALFTALIFGSVALLVTRSWLAIAVVGVGLGVIGQQKLSEAVLVLGFASLCAVGARGLRGLLGLGAVTVATWLGLWLATGQSIDHVMAWVDGAIEMSTGYSAALGLERPGNLWHYVVAVLLVLMILTVAWQASTALGRQRRYALVAATIWALWLTWNAAFTRHDLHAQRFFDETIVLTLGLILVGGRGPSLRLGLVTLVVAYLSLNAMVSQFLTPIDRSDSLRSLNRTLMVLSSEQVRSQLLSDARARLANEYETTPELRAELRKRPTLADPSSISALWAAGGPTLLPLPTLQLTTSFTDELDRLNGEHFASQPRQILRDVPFVAADGRYPPWDSPSYAMQVYCSYEVTFETPPWQVLRPASHDICGRPSGAVSFDVAADQLVDVPSRPGQLTVVTIKPEISLLERMQTFLFKPDPTYVRYGAGVWRYAHGDQANRLMLNAPTPHAAYPMLPLEPYDAISIDRPAELTFEFVAVEPVVTEVAPVTPEVEPAIATGIDALRIRAATDAVAPVLVAPEVLFSNDVALRTPQAGCVTADPIAIDPYIAMAVPTGSALRVTSEVSGPTQVFIPLEGEYSMEQSRQFVATTEPYDLSVVQPLGATGSVIRVDPPGEGSTMFCLVPDQAVSS